MHIPTPHFALRLEHQEKNLETKFNIVAGAGVKSEQEVMLAIHHHYRISREKKIVQIMKLLFSTLHRNLIINHT